MTGLKAELTTWTPWPATALSFTAVSLDASGKRIAQIFCAEADDTITHLGFRYGTRTGTPPTYRISLQALDTSGNPDNTVLGGGSPASATFTPPADTTWNNTWQWVALSNTIAITRGTVYAVVIDYSSGTINGSNFSGFNQSLSSGGFDRFGFPYADAHNGTSYSKTDLGLAGYKSATGVYGHPIQSQATTTVGTNGNRAAVKWTFPVNFWGTFKVRAMRIITDSEAAAGNNKYGVWDGAGTALQTVTIDSDAHVSPGNTNRSEWISFAGTLATLKAGTPYYFGIERVGASCGMSALVFAASGDLAAMPYQGAAILSTWNGSAWADTNTRMPIVGLQLDDITPAGRARFLLGGLG